MEEDAKTELQKELQHALDRQRVRLKAAHDEMANVEFWASEALTRINIIKRLAYEKGVSIT